MEKKKPIITWPDGPNFFSKTNVEGIIRDIKIKDAFGNLSPKTISQMAELVKFPQLTRRG